MPEGLKNIAGAENYKFRKNIIVFILRKSYLEWIETIFDGILYARNLICTFITYFRVAEANMGGVIWHKPCLLTNFQSISFFPVLLETKGFLPALPPKVFSFEHLKSCWQGLYAGNKNLPKSSSTCKLCKGGRAKLHQHNKSKNLTVKLQWLHENSFPHIPTWIFSSAFLLL